MRHWRAVAAFVTVLVCVLSAPLAMASNNCMAMGALCEGPCGASSCTTTSVPGSAVRLLAAASLSLPAPEHLVSALFSLPDPPPRPALLSL